MKSDFIIIIDSREQRPYDFQNIKPESPETIIQGLNTGDYSVVGLEDKICCERKSISDLFSSVGSGRKRFENEMVRMSEFDYAALIIESSLAGIFMCPPGRSRMNTKAVFRTLISWSIKYNVHVWPMWDRESAEKVTYLILKKYWDNSIKAEIEI
jgi:ERCC4-type nuclease